ncbi:MULTISPECIES: hypothetical protein [Hyphomonas]|jgi:hypothetical protein|uniref:hypothetical protein n=1 Tax=Hyphomonas TaxID=85 RepID=UPI000B31E368|nr:MULTISPECIES: hypothetical protein [Hyphomonas]
MPGTVILFAGTGNSKAMPCQPARNGYREMEGDSSMRLITGLALIAILPGLAACDLVGPGPIAGGPCSYETSIVEGTVTEVDEDGALLMGEEGEFWVTAEYLGTLPEVGDTLTLQRERITEGTCTPEIYSVVETGN